MTVLTLQSRNALSRPANADADPPQRRLRRIRRSRRAISIIGDFKTAWF